MQSPEIQNIYTGFPPSSNESKAEHKDTSNNNNNNNNNNNIKSSLASDAGSVSDAMIIDDDLCPPAALDLDMKRSCDKSSNGLNSSSENENSSKDEEKPVSDDEAVDEPDAMSIEKESHLDNLQKDINDDSRKQYNGYTDSAEEDMDEDDRLVIDDEEARSLSKSTSVMDQVFSCPQCHVMTTSAKAYLYHLDNVHNVKASGKKPLTTAEEDDGVVVSSNAMERENNFLNLSIPIHNDIASSSPRDEDQDEDESSLNTTPAFSLNSKAMAGSMPLGITTENIDQMFDDDKKKKKKTRQEVDPGKYFEAVDGSGTKYACSQCGNIYKWRKSLNKHWKEKHMNDPLVEVSSPPGMLELLKSGKYTQLGSRRIYDNNFLQTIKAQKDDDISGASTPNSEIKSSTPTNFMDISSHSLNASDSTMASPLHTTLLPKMIGPFVASTAQPVFPGMGMALQHIALQQNGYDSTSDEGALDLTQAAKSTLAFANFLSGRSAVDLNSSFDQDQPLDFSKKKGVESNIKSEKIWDDAPSPSMRTGIDSFGSKVHRCTKCDYSSTSEMDFANHTSSHYSKRVCKCFECKMQLNSMEELNAHYVRDHNRKLTEYKEAIKKIPHGLQQTYHLLKMDLQSIGELNNQDLGSSESKSLKCKKCDFEAKWPAELQKHAVSHSEERPYICMVCGSTYKWKWDLVKHFQKSHPALPNPYRRNDKRETPDISSEDEMEEEPDMKRPRTSGSSSDMTSGVNSPYNQDDMISVKGIMAATQAGQRFISSQPNLLDDESSPLGESLALMQTYPYAAAAAAAAVASGTPVNLAQEFVERHQMAQKAIQDAIKNRQNMSTAKSPSSGGPSQSQSSSPVPGPSSSSSSSSSNKTEQLPYKCTMCNYHARWPSEVTQHMKNHSDCKPYLCPRCDYRSKWKWDVVKHLKRCGGGTINDVIDTTKIKNKDSSPANMVMSSGPPNAIVSQQGKLKKTTPQPLSFIVPSVDANGQQSALVVKSSSMESTANSSHPLMSNSETVNESCFESRNKNMSPNTSDMIDLTTNINNNDNNNDESVSDNNLNNNYAAYSDGQPMSSLGNMSNLANSSSTNEQHKSHNISTSSPSPLPANTNPSATVTPTATTSYRQSSSSEIWNCPHCPFTTQSQAELKRHSGLHMDDKPFKCNECHYSTRWACDLKKHRKSYDHYPKNNGTINNSNITTKNNDKEAFGISKSLLKAKNNEENTKKENKGRFKCYECFCYFINLQGLIEHRRNTHSPAENSSAQQTVDTSEIDAARIKHPRKQIKQFSCPKCPFICKNRQTMDKHIEEHEQMERDAFQCFYCSSQYKDKEALLDHIVTHPAFNAKEWETFFMITEEEEQMGEEENSERVETESGSDTHESQQASMLKNSAAFREDQMKMDSEAATQARIQQILDEIPKQKNVQLQQQQQQQNCAGFNKFKCEWCPAEFINLTSVYKHASVAHPIQLKEQDVSMSLANARLQNKTQDEQRQQQQTNFNSKIDTHSGEALQMLKQQIAEKRNHQLVEKFNHMVSNNPKLQEVLNKRLEEDMNGGKRFQCDKCTFSTTSQAAFQNHYELHGTKLQSQCWFCEYSVNNMEMLYQHMKISHTRKWKALSQDTRYANQIQRMNLAFAKAGSLSSPPLQVTNNITSGDPPSHGNSNDAGGAMDLSSKKSASDLGHEIVYVRKPQYTWSGIPVNVIPDGTALNFVCPKCSFNDASIAKTCSHVMQSHRAMSKFNCTRCQFSDDNIHVMSDHCKTCHPVKERIVEVLDFKQLNFTELQMVQLNAMKEKTSQETNKDIASEKKPIKPAFENSSPAKALSCPFCPFKTDAKEIMKHHIGNHSQNSKFRCQICDFSSDSPSIMADHVKVHDMNYREELKTPQNFATSHIKNEKEIQNPKENRNNMHLKELENQEQNARAETSATAASNEVVKASSPKAKTPGRIRYRCSICPYHTTCKSNIFKHKRQHIIPKRYKCTNCSYTAARAVLLRKHIESHSLAITDEDGYYHDIFYDPHMSNDKVEDTEETGENEEVEPEDISEEDSNSDDLDNEMNTKAIADLEAKFILEAEAAHKALSISIDESGSIADNSNDKQQQLRKQKCHHCPFSSNSAYEFQKHLNFHGTQERYKCDHCSYSIDRFNLLTQHRKLHINDPGYSPNPVPSDLLNTSFILQQNEIAAAAASMEEDKEDASISEMDSDPNTNTQYHCTSCSYKVANKKSFDVHCQSHGQKKRFICDFCDWSAEWMPLLQQHRKAHENEPTYKSAPVESIFLNQEYDDGASGEFEAKFMEVPDNENKVKDGDNTSDVHNSPPFKLTVVKKSYPCKLCPYKTNSKNNYHIHKSMHSSDGEFSCTKCSFSAISQGLLQQHSILHSSDLLSTVNNHRKDSHSSSGGADMTSPTNSQSEITCERCPYTATSPSSLSNHMKGHNSQNKLVSCPYCDFKATSLQDMYPHIQIHFPGTKLELEAIDKMLEEHAGKEDSGNLNNNNNNESFNVVNQSSSSTTSDKMSKNPSLSDNQVIKTKIYVCQYCEREFEAKSLMIQHEKQHLVGSH